MKQKFWFTAFCLLILLSLTLSMVQPGQATPDASAPNAPVAVNTALECGVPNVLPAYQDLEPIIMGPTTDVRKITLPFAWRSGISSKVEIMEPKTSLTSKIEGTGIGGAALGNGQAVAVWQQASVDKTNTATHLMLQYWNEEVGFSTTDLGGAAYNPNLERFPDFQAPITGSTPVVASPEAGKFYVFGRSSLGNVFFKYFGSTGISSWAQVPMPPIVTDESGDHYWSAVSDPAVIFLDPSRMLVFVIAVNDQHPSDYKLILNQGAQGYWASDPQIMSVPSGATLTAMNPVAVAPSEGRAAVFVQGQVGSTYNIYGRIWTVDSSNPDWSNTTYATVASGVSSAAPFGAGSRWQNHFIVAYQKTDTQVYVREWQYANVSATNNGWGSEASRLSPAAAVTSLAVQGVDTDEMVLTAVYNNTLYSKKWDRTAWETQPTTVGTSISGPHVAIYQSMHSVLVFEKYYPTTVADQNKPVFFHLTDRGATVKTESAINTSLSADPDGQRIVYIGGQPYWLNVYAGATNWVAEVRSIKNWSGISINLGHVAPTHPDAFRFSVAVADMDLDGDDEPVIVTLNHAQTQVDISWLAITATNTASTNTVTAVVEKGLATFGGSFGKGVSVAIGDLDSTTTTAATADTVGDGKKNEVFVSTLLSGNQSWQVNYYQFTPSTANVNEGTLAAQEMGDKGKFSVTLSPKDKKTAIDTLTTVAGHFDDGDADKLIFLVGREGAASYSEVDKYTLSSTTTIHSLGAEQWIPEYELGPKPALAADDVNVDGIDELLVAGHALFVVNMTKDNLPTKISKSKGSPYIVGVKRLAVGDIDQDGHKEIIMVRNYTTTGRDGYIYRVSNSQNLLELARFTGTGITPLVADLDGDSKVATFDTTISCAPITDAMIVQSVVYTPPVFYNADKSDSINSYLADFAMTHGLGDGTTLGQHVNFGFTFGLGFKKDITIPLIGWKVGETSFMFSYEMEGKMGWKQQTGKNLDVGTGWTAEPNDTKETRGMVIYTSINYTCYTYTMRDPVADEYGHYPTATMQFCTPPQNTPTAHKVSIEKWYDLADVYNVPNNPAWMAISSEGVPQTSLPPLNDINDASNKYAVRINPPVAEELIITQANTATEVPYNETGTQRWWFSYTSTTGKVKTGEFDHNFITAIDNTALTINWKVEGKVGGGHEWENTTTWTENTTYGGTVGSLPDNPATESYSFVPYLYKATGVTRGGTSYSYQVLDYFVDQRPIPPPVPTPDGNAAASPTPPAPAQTPQAPVVQSSTHPDPNQWYGSAPSFTWSQPAGDTAPVVGYRFFYTLNPDNNPQYNDTLAVTSHSYTGLPDGLGYFHVMAVGENGVTSPVTHLAIQVDTTPPTARLDLNPVMPDGLNGWHNHPLSVNLSATDARSGVATVEYSLDNSTWLPYTAGVPFTANTAGTTVYGRATDAAGNTSEPVSVTFKIDLDRPTIRDSKLQRLSYADIQILPNGNAQLKLGGPLNDLFSGRNTVMLQGGADGMWNAADEVGVFDITGWENDLYPANDGPTTVNWLFTSNYDVRGIYLLKNYGLDMAGNRTTTADIGLFWWEPDAAPNLEESQASFNTAVAHQGDTVEITVAARNTGYQESLVKVTDTLPAGVEALPETISEGGTYNPATRQVTWEIPGLWPGETRLLRFSAVLSPDLAPGTLQNQLDLEGYWNWMEDYYGTLLPPEPQHQFFSTSNSINVVTVEKTAGEPALSAVGLYEGGLVESADVTVMMNASPDAKTFFIKEWVWDDANQQWHLAKQSGWKPFEPSAYLSMQTDSQGIYARYNWQLDFQQGVHYLGVWVADENGQISSLNNDSLLSTNLVQPAMQTLAAGEKVQYRFMMTENDLAVFNLIMTSGSADLYAWNPRRSFHPDYSAITQDLGGGIKAQTMAFYAPETGVYILEIRATQDTVFQLVTVASDRSSGLTSEGAQMLRQQASQALETGAYGPAAPADSLPANPFTLSSPWQLGNVLDLPNVNEPLFRTFIPCVINP